MKVLVIGGNRFVGLRLCHILTKELDLELHVVNRTGVAPHAPGAIIHKGDRDQLHNSFLDKEWDLIFDFACFTAAQAEASVEYFKTKRYIFISTISVYDFGEDLREEAFQPQKFDLNLPPSDREPGTLYQYGKRQAEAVFSKVEFPVLMVRFPLILGPDDYTHRLHFHVEHIQTETPMYIPNVMARLPMIHSEDAAAFLKWTLDSKLEGPLNVASPDSLAVGELMATIEKITGKAARITPDKAADHSPYGLPHSLTVNTKKLISSGFEVKPISSWITELISSLCEKRVPDQTH